MYIMRYYGITIGPIIETMSLVAKPAGLWYVSYMFSDITRKLCHYFFQNKNISILSPYYEDDEVIDGVGSYYDRIIFSVAEDKSEEIEEFVQKTIQKVKTEVGERLARDIKKNACDEFIKNVTEYMKRYLCIHYTSVAGKQEEMKSPGGILSKYLDALELYRNIQKPGDKNYLLDMLQGIEESSNIYIRNSSLIKEILGSGAENFQLFERGGENIKNLAYISGAGKVKKLSQETVPDSGKWKKWKYYAIVQADGDRLGKMTENLLNKNKDDSDASKNILDKNKSVADKEKSASGYDLDIAKVCKKYTKECAKLIGEYGGMTIFAGGDDLLFLAPLQNREGEDLFELCHKIHDAYKHAFEDLNSKVSEENQTTLSMGVLICYWKFPLYEALEDVRSQLIDYAKVTRNTLAVKLKKASGKSIMDFQYFFDSKKEDKFLEFIKYITKKEENMEEVQTEICDEILKSVLHHIKNYEVLFKKAIIQGKEEVESCFDNLFSDSKQEDYLRYSREMFLEIMEEVKDSDMKSKDISDIIDMKYQNIISVLQLIHFLLEEEGGTKI